jgi:hypothetical protein
MCLLDLIPMLRNHLLHGNIHLLPQQTATNLELCAKVLNKLFDMDRGGPSPLRGDSNDAAPRAALSGSFNDGRQA